MEGPDHSFAIEPDELAAMVTGIRDAEAALGDGRKEGPESRGARGELRARAAQPDRSARPAGRARCSTPDMLTVKRPGFGIAPKHLELVVGRTLRADVEADDVLTWEMV